MSVRILQGIKKKKKKNNSGKTELMWSLPK